MTNTTSRFHTKSVGVFEAPCVDPLGNHAYNDNNYPCDGADLGLLEGDMHIDCDNSCALDQDLHRDMEEQT